MGMIWGSLMRSEGKGLSLGWRCACWGGGGRWQYVFRGALVVGPFKQ
jgi:hypothetical protein